MRVVSVDSFIVLVTTGILCKTDISLAISLLFSVNEEATNVQIF